MIIDVSIHNGSVNWAKVKAAGVTGAIIRCGYGKDLKRQDDSRFTANIEGAIANGLRVGVYIYSYAKTIESAKSEAAHVLRLIEPYKTKISLPIYYDLEEPGTERGAKERAIVFGDIVEKAGYWVGIYASLSWFTTHLSGLDRFTKWVAAWGKNTGTPGTKPAIACDLWQYTSNARVNGINGRVDASELLNDKIGGYIGSASSSKPTTPTTNKPTAEKQSAPTTQPTYINYKIKKGDTLSAIAKKYKTTVKAIKAANPEKIKNVNKIYAGDVIKIPTN